MATGGGEIAGGSVERSLGQLASLLGRPDDALAHLDRPRAVHRAYRADIWVTHTDVDEAVVRLRRGTDDDRRVAAHLLQAAGEVSRRRGWDALASRVDELVGVPRPRRAARRADAARGRGRSLGRPTAGRTVRSPRSSCCQSAPSSLTCSTSSRSWASPPARRSPRGWYGADSTGPAEKISTAAPWSPRWRDVCDPASSSR